MTATFMLASKHPGPEVKILYSCALYSACSVTSHVQLTVTPWTTAREAPLSVGFSRQETWSGLPFPPPALCSTEQ